MARAVHVRILYVDDEPLVGRALVRALRGSGCSLSTVATSEDALAAIEKEEWDVVVSDLVMPGMDGLQLLRRVRSRHPGARRLLMTGYHGEERVRRAVREGLVEQVLSKPISIGRLAAVLGIEIP